MRREDLTSIFYGKGPMPYPWATDCPIRFGTWFSFAQPLSDEAERRRVDVILSVNEEHGVRRVLDHFTSLNVLGPSQPIAAGSFVVARLTFDELIRAVLPLTNLFGVVRLAQKIPRQDLEQAIRNPDQDGITTLSDFPTEDEKLRVKENIQHLIWLVTLLVTVAESAAMLPETVEKPRISEFERHSAALDSIFNALQSAMAERSLTQLPPEPGNQVIDRRRRYPVVSVTTNRVAAPAVSRSRQTVKADAAEAVFAVDCSTIGWAVLDSGIDAGHPAFAVWDISVTPPTIWNQQSRVMRTFDLVNARNMLSQDTTDNGLIDWAKVLPYLEMLVPNQIPVAGNLLRLQPYSAPNNPHGTHVAGVLGGY